MRLTVCRLAACAAVGGLALALSMGTTAAQDKEKQYTIKEIMKIGHQGTKSLLKGIGAQIEAQNWEEAANGAKTLKTFGEQLGKLEPDRGDAESWKKLTEEYKKRTAAVAAGVEKKDAKAATTALKQIGGSCKGCHDAHK
jgi:cytochrome c556